MLHRSCPWCERRWRDGDCGCLPPTGDGPIRRTVVGLDAVRAVHHYDPVIERFVLAAKNGSRRDLLRVFGHRLADLASDVDDAGAATITWVPASRSGRRRRGYDQARLLARSLAHRSGRPILPLLTRAGGRSQAGQRRIERLSGPELSCRARPPVRVIVVDDVVTTGASLAAAAAALREAGSQHVLGLCVASAARESGPK